MLKIYSSHKQGLQQISNEEALKSREVPVWYDLFDPTKDEEHFVEELLGIDVPTRDEMHEIELSSRLYLQDGALYATATLVTNSETPEPETHAVTYILTRKCLITVRYSEPYSFRSYIKNLPNLNSKEAHGGHVFAGLIEAAVNRVADILETTGHQLDSLNRQLFRVPLVIKKRTKEEKAAQKRLPLPEKPDYALLIREIGVKGDLLSKIMESLLSMNRILGFVSSSVYMKSGSAAFHRTQTLMHDISALNDHAGFLTSKVNFLLDATLGMVGIEQNAIIKIFSVAAVIFLPPTLVASIYGMNFHFMPELDWHYGYPMALSLMLLSAWLPYRFFKRKKWL